MPLVTVVQGGMCAFNLHVVCSVEEGVPCCIMLRFCAEGDNVLDAVEVATYINALFKWINLEVSKPKHIERCEHFCNIA